MDYGYNPDSDLEVDDETAVSALEKALRKAAPPIEDAVKDVLRKVTPRKGTLKRVLRTGSLRRIGSVIAPKPQPPRERYSERAYKGKVIRVPDMAFIT